MSDCVGGREVISLLKNRERGTNMWTQGVAAEGQLVIARGGLLGGSILDQRIAAGVVEERLLPLGDRPQVA